MNLNLDRGTNLTHYVLRDFKGKGTTAEVWSAIDTRNNSVVALKIFAPEVSLDNSSKKLIKEEYLKTKDLDHPNIINPIDHFEIEGRPVLVFKLCDHSLWEELRLRVADRLKNNDEDKNNIFSEAEMAKLLFDIGGALDFIHKSNLIHHDVKPANILLIKDNGNYDFFLSDFGITKEIRETIIRQTKARNSSLTLAYAAPERLRGEVDNSFKSDIFSLGATIYEMTNSIKIPPGEILNNNGSLKSIKGKYSLRFKELIQSFLLKDYPQRPSAEDILVSAKFYLSNGYWPENVSNDKEDRKTQMQSYTPKDEQKIDGDDNNRNGNRTIMQGGNQMYIGQVPQAYIPPQKPKSSSFGKKIGIGLAVVLILAALSYFVLPGYIQKPKDAVVQINCKNGYRIVQLKNKKCGIVNANGEWVINPYYNKCINMNDSIILKATENDVDIFLIE